MKQEKTMSTSKSPHTLEELSRLGLEIFERRVRPILRPEDDGHAVAIDVNTGEYELDVDEYTALERLRARCSDADMWLTQVGHPVGYQTRSVR